MEVKKYMFSKEDIETIKRLRAASRFIENMTTPKKKFDLPSAEQSKYVDKLGDIKASVQSLLEPFQTGGDKETAIEVDDEDQTSCFSTSVTTLGDEHVVCEFEFLSLLTRFVGFSRISSLLRGTLSASHRTLRLLVLF